MKLHFEIKDKDFILKNHGLQEGGTVQQKVDDECMRFMGDYMPRRQSGKLNRAMKTATVSGSGRIDIPVAYAHYLHEGILYVSPSTGSSWAKFGETKVPTDRELTYAGAPMRGKKWFDRMKADHKDDILRAAQTVMDRGGKA